MIFYGPAFPRARADERGHDPHPDDIAPPAAHLMPAPGVDVIAVFAAEVEAAREDADGEMEFLQCPHELIEATCAGVCLCPCAPCAPSRVRGGRHE